VTVEQVARVTQFTEAGVMVHCYLMYGYPTQTVQETVDSLEMVRQLFEAGIAVWLLASICHDGAQSCWNTSEKFGVKKKPKLLAPSPITTSIILTPQGLIIISLVLDLRSLYLISCTASVSTMNCRSGLNSKSED
jgi:hypothetical protein